MDAPSNRPRKPRLLLNFVLALIVIAFAYALDRSAKAERTRRSAERELNDGRTPAAPGKTADTAAKDTADSSAAAQTER